MMEAEFLIPIAFFGMIAAIFIVPALAKERTKRSAHDLVGQALSRGQQLDPALVSQLTQNMLDEGNRARKSLGNGVILLALAGGITGAAYASDGFDHGFHSGMFAPAIILGSVGLAFLVLAIFDYSTKKNEA
jgi:hypothetical protein